MDGWLKQSTGVTVKIGPFLDDTDGKTAETALVLAQADIRVSKNGAAIAQKDNANACPHDEKGLYDCGLSTTDSGTLALLRLDIQKTGALPVWHTFMVLPAQVWDSFFGADKLQVHADEITAGLITATAIADNALANAKIADGAITAAKIADNAIAAAKIADNAITDAKINAGAISAAKFAANAIDSTVMADGAITAGKIASDAIAATKIADNAFTANKFAAASLNGKGDWSTFNYAAEHVTLANGAHGGATATLQLDGAIGLTTITGINANVVGNITGNLSGSVGSVSAGVTLAEVAHGGPGASLTLSNFADFKATGFMPSSETGTSFTAIPWNAAWDAEVESECYDALNTAITDASGLNAGSLLERIRVLGWILRNKVEVTNLNGNTVIYKDDNSTSGFSVNTMLTDDSTTTTRLRAA